MSLVDPQLATVPTRLGGRAIIVTSYGTGAERGENLGAPGYSYDLVAQLFAPLLSRWGEIIPTAREPQAVETAVQNARRRGLDPIHLSFVACPDMVFSASAPNAIAPRWAYPDVPGEAFDGNPQNDWMSTANRCDLVLVAGEFTAEALRRAGVRTPIRVVPVPTPDDYFALPPWRRNAQVRMACSAYVFPDSDVSASALWDAPDAADQNRATVAAWSGSVGRWMRRTWEERCERLAPPLLAQGVRWMAGRLNCDRWRAYVRRCRRDEMELSGVVYVSVLNPSETRKNGQDLLTGFVSALGDRNDATLVVKLVTHQRSPVRQFLEFYRGIGLSHRCKIVFITDCLSPAHMLALARASTYYLTTTRAEGACLPLMNYLAAGRPGVSARHSAIGDYFDEDVGLTIACHPEPAPWPRDGRARIKTTSARLDWTALVERLHESYELALHDRPGYDARAAVARQRLRERASAESVWPRLAAALSELTASCGRSVRVA